MIISSKQVQQLRSETGAGILDAKHALEEASGDLEKAREILRTKGLDRAASKSGRDTHEGRVEAYIHSNKKIGVLVKLYCETDFVARNDQFTALAHDLALHIAAASPLYVSSENIPQEVLKNEKRIYLKQSEGENKSSEVLDKIVEGKMKKFAEEVSLLNQPFVKDTEKSVDDVIKEHIARLGENIQVGGFVRYEL